MSRVLAVVAVVILGGCDALWRIDAIEIPHRGDAAVDTPIGTDASHVGPFAHFKMDEVGLIVAAHDDVGQVDAVCVNGAPSPVAGKIGGALDFAGGSQRLELVPTGAFLDVEQFSIVGWLKPDTLAAEACAWSKPYLSGAADTWQLCINPDGAVSFITYGAGGSMELSSTLGLATPGVDFHHAAIVFDGTVKTLYWDGQSKGTQSVLPLLVDANNIIIANDVDGSTGTRAPYHGALDEVAFYDYALTAAEVAALAAQ